MLGESKQNFLAWILWLQNFKGSNQVFSFKIVYLELVEGPFLLPATILTDQA